MTGVTATAKLNSCRTCVVGTRMAEDEISLRLAAIVAADVAGYSRLMGEDEEVTLAALRTHPIGLIDPKSTSTKAGLLTPPATVF